MRTTRHPPHGGMTARMPAVLLMVGLVLATGGCVRTDDGSIAVARQLDVARYWHRPPSAPQTPPVQSGADVFPVAPAGGWSKPAHPSARKARKDTGRKNVPARPLTCRDDFQAGQRARVVCQ